MPGSPVRLTVSEIRQEIYEVSEHRSAGAGGVVGQLFHKVARCALTDEHPACWKRALTSDLNEPEWLASLYNAVLGPGLTRLQPSLADRGEDILCLWSATQQFVHWFIGLLRQAIANGGLQYDGRREEWIGAGSLFQVECDVEKVIQEPGWTSSVVVSGRLDQFVRRGPDQWCVVEFKLGGGHAEADAAQVCLYHELLGGTGSAALVHFGNDPQTAQEILFQKAAIDAARPSLISLIGALAGVSPATLKSGISAEAEPPVKIRLPDEADREIGRKLERTLREYGAEAHVSGDPQVGPTFVRYQLEPQRGVTVRRIEGRGAELQVRLGLEQEPIIHRVDGRIAIDVQRRDREYVPFASLRAQLAANAHGSAKMLAGVDLAGRLYFLDLARDSPHVLVGGETGSGKTEWLRAAIASLIVTNTPETLRLVVVDPAEKAFTELEGSPFLLHKDALIDSHDKSVLSLLEDLIEEIKRRKGLFKHAAADDIAQYRRKTGQVLPRVVTVVDEFAELLQSGSRRQRDEFEQRFIRIAQIGRAFGIHLVLATQRPSRQVVSGNLKANLPGKIAMRVSTRINSAVLIDQSGAERLLGRGDLLLAGLSSEPVRLQSAWLSEEERRLIFGRPVPSAGS
jgi:hypothetical protein